MHIPDAVSKFNIPLVYGITLHSNHIVVINSKSSITYVRDCRREDISFSQGVKTPVADIVVISYREQQIGRLIICKYILSDFRVLHHASMFLMSTRHTGQIYSDDVVSLHSQDDILIVIMAPDYPLDGDSAKDERDEN